MTITRRFIAALLALLIAAPVLAQAQRTYTQAELDQMLAPIALYPDPLLSQVLMAATYPAEVGEAARWSRANPGLQGDEAVRAAHNEDWDPSVKSLVAFPQVLARMGENPGWTQSLGDAFLMQEPHVMDTVQQLRRRAQAAGNLQSSEQMYVQQQGQAILVQPASPQYVHVPYYDPWTVYGSWWWPDYQPVYWAPWPGYARHHRPGVSVGFWWGTPVGLSVNFFFGNFDWHHRHVRVAHPTAHYYRSAAVANRTLAATPQRWQNDPLRRRGIALRAPDGQRPFAATARRAPAAPVVAQPAAASAAARAVVPATRENRTESRNRVDRPRNEVRADPRVESRIERAPAARVQALPQAQPQVRMPAASAPQQPRAARQEQQQERRELRQERRNERGQKGSERT